jgi:hypothetical protein
MLQLNVGMRIVCAGLFYHLLEYALVNAYILNGTMVLKKLAMCHIYHVFLIGRKLKKNYSIVMGSNGIILVS